MIRNPNEIVTALVGDFSEIYGDRLQSMVLYGSAVSHEYVPGRSSISLLLTMSDVSIDMLRRAASVHVRWMKKGVAAPRYTTSEQLSMHAVLAPVAILSMQYEYRVLYGDDVLAALTLSKKNLLRHCQYMLVEITRQCTDRFIVDFDHHHPVEVFLVDTIKTLVPCFRAMLVVYDQKIPHVTTELIAAFEDLFGLGSSVFSEVYIASGCGKKSIFEVFDKFYDTIKSVQTRLATVQITDEMAKTVT